jgi:hypothetical protein
MLSLPAHQFYNRGRYKYILRNAMQGILPEHIRERTTRTSLMPLFTRGLEREAATARALLYRPNARWPAYIQPEWLGDCLGGHAGSEVENMALWQCLSLELWQRPGGSRAESVTSMPASGDTGHPVRIAQGAAAGVVLPEPTGDRLSLTHHVR